MNLIHDVYFQHSYHIPQGENFANEGNLCDVVMNLNSYYFHGSTFIDLVVSHKQIEQL